ncbi:PQQ-binding-like beta-propeller repeat protein [Nocardiopsis sp. MG754419]|uniref:outer membrane protein assembly factor BamB family protein n=1 Tax=Nocardiopsis sp. MG754419 TaxID=2259865 RepID=UPI001BAB15D9|nr:PQQ-binding-like beta-propeller repeat protein [Nocardiopsis sp. MG754419]
MSWYQERAGLIHETAQEDPGLPAAYPVGPPGHGWSWSPPADTTVIDLVRGTHGPVALLADGLVALDGSTGRELWTYRDLTAPALDPQAPVASGGGVLGERASFLRPPEGDDPGRFVSLDAATGTIVGEWEVHADDLAGGWNVFTPRVYLHSLTPGEAGALPADLAAGSTDRGVVLARAPQDGEDLWAFRPPWPTEVCATQGEPLIHSGQDTGVSGWVVLVHACIGEDELAELSLGEFPDDPLVFAGRAETLTANVTALDPYTGRVLWADTRPVTDAADTVTLRWLDRSPPIPGEPPALLAEAVPEPLTPFVVEPVEGRRFVFPEEAVDEAWSPVDPGVRILRADTSGLVVAVDRVDEAYVPDAEWAFDALSVDPEGAVEASVTVDEEGVTEAHLAHAVALEQTLLLPTLDTEEGRARVYTAPLDGGEEGGAWTVSLPTSRADAEHRLLAVPGAVVSHLTDGARVTDIHGLVP